MRIDRVIFHKTYNLGNYNSEKIGFEADVDECEHIEDVVTELKKMCDTYHKTNNPHLYKEQESTAEYIVNGNGSKTLRPLCERDFIKDYVQVTNTEIPPQPLTQEQKFINLISLATSVKELSMYEKTANNPKYPSLKEAYNNKLNQLSNA